MSPWDDFWPKLVLTLVDKVGLGIAAVVFGYWVQKWLEIFKRNQAIVTEITRAHLEAMKKVFAAVYGVDGALFQFEDVVGLPGEQRAAASAFQERLGELRRTVAQERFPLGPSMFEAARNLTDAYARYFETYIGEVQDPDAGSRIKIFRTELHELAPDLDVVPKNLLRTLLPKKRRISSR